MWVSIPINLLFICWKASTQSSQKGPTKMTVGASEVDLHLEMMPVLQDVPLILPESDDAHLTMYDNEWKTQEKEHQRKHCLGSAQPTTFSVDAHFRTLYSMDSRGLGLVSLLQISSHGDKRPTKDPMSKTYPSHISMAPFRAHRSRTVTFRTLINKVTAIEP